jgi:D-glucosaminate-6-phosphate ammonia-lyase
VTPRPRKASDADIYAATRRAMSQVGPNALTLADIAAEAGLTAGALVQRFGSKRELLLAVAARWADQTGDALEKVAAAQPSPLARLYFWGERMAAMGGTPEGVAHHLAYLQLDLADPEFRAHAQRSAGVVRATFARWLDEAVSSGELEPETDTWRLARLTETTISGSLVSWAIHQERDAAGWIRHDLEAVLEPHRPFRGVGIYDELGVRPFINAVAPHTRFGGAVMSDRVVEAMVEAARHSVDLHALQAAAGAAIARLTRNEACYISCGAAAGVQLAVAACIAGTDEERVSQLPTVGERTHVVMLRSHAGTEADMAIRNTGASIRHVDESGGATGADVAAALDVDTVAVVLLDWESDGIPGVAEVVEVAQERGVPVIVDAADAVPPFSNFWKHTQDAGADAVVVSGGKRLGGPQDSGLVLGRRAIVDACAFLGSPNDRFGRSMKVSKEAMAGVYAAVRELLEREDALAEASRERAMHVVRELSSLDGVTVQRVGHEAIIRLGDPRLREDDIRARLLEGDPAILVSCRHRSVRIDAWLLRPGEERVVARRVRQVLDLDTPSHRLSRPGSKSGGSSAPPAPSA